MDNLFALEIVVANYFGVCTRVVTQFSKRGYNIHSMIANPIPGTEVTKMLIVVDGGEYEKDQLLKQCGKLYDVKSIRVVPVPKDGICRKTD